MGFFCKSIKTEDMDRLPALHAQAWHAWQTGEPQRGNPHLRHRHGLPRHPLQGLSTSWLI